MASFYSFPYANAISCTLVRLFLAGDAWGVPGEGNLPFHGLGENGALPLVDIMANNTKKIKNFAKRA